MKRIAGPALLYFLALIMGVSFYATRWIVVDPGLHAVWKGAGVGLLAVWAATRARRLDQWLIAAVLGLGALGDVLLDTLGMTAGAVAFLAGHCTAAALYLRHRSQPVTLAGGVALAVALAAWLLPDDRAAAPGIALYALGLGAMFGSALASRFTLSVKLGAALFVFSDLLIFAELGPLRHAALPGLLIWPTYFAGQALIAWGVIGTLAGEARESLHYRL